MKKELNRYKNERKIIKSTPKYAPAGQSTQMIVGATGETDKDIMYSATHFYKNFNMKRVYYSGYVPVAEDSRLPSIGSQVPMLRENRLYQTDWLMRLYGFAENEILKNERPNLDDDIDPKLSWALRNMHLFPVGLKSVQKIVNARKFRKLNWDHLKKIGVALNRAKYFMICDSRNWESRDLDAEKIKGMILQNSVGKFRNQYSTQLSLFN